MSLQDCTFGPEDYESWHYYFEVTVKDLSDVIGFVFVAFLFSSPVILGIVLWKVFDTDKIGRGVISLGLEETSFLTTQTSKPLISKWNLLLYLFTCALTFKLGVLAFETYQYLRALFSSWFG
jgi:hypothetical protein